MGDVLYTTPAAKLLVQLNRFTARGQYGGRVYRGAELASGNVPASAATTAAVIYQTRLLVAQTGIPDAGTVAQLAAVNVAMKAGKTASWVAANLGPVTDVLQGYADSLGLPTWSESGSASGIPTLAIVAALGIGAYFYFGRRGSR